jgi:hypothetical protein
MLSCSRTHSSSFVFGATVALTLVLSANAGANSCSHLSKPRIAQIAHVLNLPHAQVHRNPFPDERPGESECNLQFYSGSRPTSGSNWAKRIVNGSLVQLRIRKETGIGDTTPPEQEGFEHQLQGYIKEFEAARHKATFATLGAEHVIGDWSTHKTKGVIGYELDAKAMWWNTTMTPEIIGLGLEGSKHKPVVKQLGQIAKIVVPAFL